MGFGGWKDGETQFELALLREEGAPGRGQEEARRGSWITDHECVALVLPARARYFGVRKDGETWSYRSFRPEFVPTCQPHWSTPRRTENDRRVLVERDAAGGSRIDGA